MVRTQNIGFGHASSYLRRITCKVWLGRTGKFNSYWLVSLARNAYKQIWFWIHFFFFMTRMFQGCWSSRSHRKRLALERPKNLFEPRSYMHESNPNTLTAYICRLADVTACKTENRPVATMHESSIDHYLSKVLALRENNWSSTTPPQPNIQLTNHFIISLQNYWT